MNATTLYSNFEESFIDKMIKDLNKNGFDAKTINSIKSIIEDNFKGYRNSFTSNIAKCTGGVSQKMHLDLKTNTYYTLSWVVVKDDDVPDCIKKPLLKFKLKEGEEKIIDKYRRKIDKDGSNIFYLNQRNYLVNSIVPQKTIDATSIYIKFSNIFNRKLLKRLTKYGTLCDEEKIKLVGKISSKHFRGFLNGFVYSATSYTGLMEEKKVSKKKVSKKEEEKYVEYGNYGFYPNLDVYYLNVWNVTRAANVPIHIKEALINLNLLGGEEKTLKEYKLKIGKSGRKCFFINQKNRMPEGIIPIEVRKKLKQLNVM